jgi:predicted nucleotidyltransferase
MSSKKDPVEIATGFANDMKEAFGEELQSVLLVGSAARGDYIPGKSDVNTLVILTQEGMEWLEKAYPLLQRWQRKKLAVPHFMVPDALNRALDSYPLEFLDFKTFHRIILGPDILAEISIPKDPLRLQIERELRGKLFLLRQIFASEAGRANHLQATLKRSVSVFTAVFQGILDLSNQPIPGDRVTLFREVTAIVGCSEKTLQQILEIRDGKRGKNFRVVFKELLGEMNTLVNWIDSYQVR